MNAERLSKMQSQVRIGGKGTQRRKKKVVHKTNTDDKKLQNSLKKLAVNAIPGIEEVHMIKDDGHVIHFNNPKVQASLPANTFAITGHAETKQVTDLVPRILNSEVKNSDEDDVPELVEDFDSAATKGEQPQQQKQENKQDEKQQKQDGDQPPQQQQKDESSSSSSPEEEKTES